MKKTVINTTVNNGLCVGCGLCAAICPWNALTMINKNQYNIEPSFNDEACVNCGLCAKHCPLSIEKIKEENNTISRLEDYWLYGVKNASCFIGYVKDKKARFLSASGGLTTYLAGKMLEEKMVELVIHAKAVTGQTGDIHFKATYSVDAESLKSARSSVYCMLSFEDCYRYVIENKIKRVLVIGTPCIVKSAKSFFEEQSWMEQIYTIALACSHNVTGLFTDYLAESLNIEKDKLYKVNFRDKYESRDAYSFNNLFYDDKGVIKRVNHFDSEFTNQWRNYSFSRRSCNACSDFWGSNADISVADAWGKWKHNQGGCNSLIVRNKNLLSLLNSGDLVLEQVSVEEMAQSQRMTIDYKLKEYKKKSKAVTGKDFDKLSIKHFLNAQQRDYSVKSYRKYGYTDRIRKHVKYIQILKMIFDNRITRKMAKSLMLLRR